MDAVDVVVVGAGPVGLLLGIELALGGVRVVVLERLSAASTLSKALGIGPLGCEALQRRGMAQRLDAAEARSIAAIARITGPNAPNSQNGPRMTDRASRISGHFGGILIRKDGQKEPERRARAVDQHDIEAMLADRACTLGIEMRRDCDVTGFVQKADGVDIEWASPNGGDHIRCAYLIGCDGGRSPIRKMAGFEFPGTPPTSTLYQAVVEIDDPEHLLPIGRHRTASGVFAYGLFPGRLFMLDFIGPPDNRDAPVTPEEIEGVLRRISGADVRVKALESGARWTDNTRLVETYRQGRVLLAGDAAHVHSPFGGQGMSLGLADAANLGWKLAAVIRGEMTESLLDTYTAERRPVAKAILENTLAQTALMRPDPQSGALRDIVANLMQLDDVNRSIGEMMRGLAARYDLGSDRDDVGRLIGDRLLGRGDGDVSLYDIMQDGLGVLLDASVGGELSRLAAGITQRVRCVAVKTAPSMLIRPDACIAWVDDEHRTDGLEEALRRWFAHL